MQFSSAFAGQVNKISDLFEWTFTASEGADEGKLIGGLAGRLIETTQAEDIHVFTAAQNDRLAGCIIFSRLMFENDPKTVFLLSPVAISPDYQKQGVGSALLKFGLSELRRDRVDVAVTYGDPAYYNRFGFETVGTEIVPPPIVLQRPEGWLAQSLTDEQLRSIVGPSRCVPALDDPAYW